MINMKTSRLDPCAQAFVPSSERRRIGTEVFAELIVPVFESRLGNFTEQLKKVLEAATVPNRRFGDIIAELICEHTFKSPDYVSTGFRFVMELRKKLPDSTRCDLEYGTLQSLAKCFSDLFTRENLKSMMRPVMDGNASAYFQNYIQNAMSAIQFCNLTISRWRISPSEAPSPLRACICLCEVVLTACRLQLEEKSTPLSLDIEKELTFFQITPRNFWPLFLHMLLDTFTQCLPSFHDLLKFHNSSIRPNPWDSKERNTNYSNNKAIPEPSDLVEILDSILCSIHQMVTRLDCLFQSQKLTSTAVETLIVAARVVGSNANYCDAQNNKLDAEFNSLNLNNNDMQEDDYDACYYDFLRETDQLPN